MPYFFACDGLTSALTGRNINLIKVFSTGLMIHANEVP